MVDFTNTDLDQVDDGTGTSVPPAARDEQERQTKRLGNFGSGVDGSTTDDGTGSTLPSNAVAPGVEVLVQAKPGNSSPVQIGLTSSPTVSIPAGSTISYRVQNTDQINIVANSSGDGVNFTAEMEA